MIKFHQTSSNCINTAHRLYHAISLILFLVQFVFTLFFIHGLAMSRKRAIARPSFYICVLCLCIDIMCLYFYFLIIFLLFILALRTWSLNVIRRSKNTSPLTWQPGAGLWIFTHCVGIWDVMGLWGHV